METKEACHASTACLQKEGDGDDKGTADTVSPTNEACNGSDTSPSNESKLSPAMIRYLHEHDRYLSFLVEGRKEKTTASGVEVEPLGGLDKDQDADSSQELIVGYKGNEQEGRHRKVGVQGDRNGGRGLSNTPRKR